MNVFFFFCNRKLMLSALQWMFVFVCLYQCMDRNILMSKINAHGQKSDVAFLLLCQCPTLNVRIKSVAWFIENTIVSHVVCVEVV